MRFPVEADFNLVHISRTKSGSNSTKKIFTRLVLTEFSEIELLGWMARSLKDMIYVLTGIID